MKIELSLSFVTFILTLPFMGQAGVTKSGYVYQGATATASWNFGRGDDFCLWSQAFMSVTEGTYTNETPGKADGAPFQDISFSYWVDNLCTQTSHGGDAYGPTGDVNISLKKNTLGATVSTVLDGSTYFYSWDKFDWTPEPCSITIDAEWSECVLMERVKSTTKYNLPTLKYMHTNADKYATECTFAVTISSDIDFDFPFDPDTAYAYLSEGQNIEVTIEKRSEKSV